MAQAIKVALTCAALLTGTPVLAQDDTGTQADHVIVHAGVGYLRWSESAKVRSNGQLIPGGDASLSNNTAVVFDAAYFLKPNVSIAIGLGLPPTTTISGTGTLAPAGRLGKITYGPSVVSVRYHLIGLGPVRPYVGGGLNYTLVFSTKDLGVKDLRITNTYGPVAQAGFDIYLNRRFGVYFDAKKVWTKSNANFLVAGTPGSARVTLNPLILAGGVSYRF
jgi:outer membrane protein